MCSGVNFAIILILCQLSFQTNEGLRRHHTNGQSSIIFLYHVGSECDAVLQEPERSQNFAPLPQQ